MKSRETLRTAGCLAIVVLIATVTCLLGNLRNAAAEESQPLPPPQLVTDAWGLIAAYKADPLVLKSLLPQGLEPNPENQVVINMYTVPDPNQTSGFGAYTLTYLAVELKGQDGYNMGQPTGYPGRYFVFYFNSSSSMREFTKKAGIPAQPGNTTATVENGKLNAVLTVDGKPFIEATADVADTLGGFGGGHFNYFGLIHTQKDGKHINQVVKYPLPYVTRAAETKNAKINFKVPDDHPLSKIKPIADPTWAVWWNGSFVYPQYQVIHEFGAEQDRK